MDPRALAVVCLLTAMPARAEEPIRALEGHKGTVSYLVFSPDSQYLASFEGGAPDSTRVWKTSDGSLAFTLPGASWGAFVEQGRQVVLLESGTLRFREVPSGKEVRTLPCQAARRPVLSPDGKRLLAPIHGDALEVCDLEKGETVSTLTGHSGPIEGTAWSPDGKRVGTVSRDQTVKVWDVSSGKEVWSATATPQFAWSVAFSPDGKSLAVGGWEKTVRVYDAGNGEETLSFEVPAYHKGVQGVAYAPDGALLATINGCQSVNVRNLDASARIRTLESNTGYAVSFHPLAFSPDGTWLAWGSGGVQGNLIRLWRVEK